MKPKVFSSQAFVLGKKNFSDTDKIITLFTRDYGKVYVIAKGIRKLSSRKRGSVEYFNHIKFSAFSGKNFDILSEVESLTEFAELKSNLRKSTLAYYILELVEKFTREEESPELFDLVLGYLEKVNNQKNLKEIRYDFVYDILVIMGFWQKGKPLKNPDKVIENVLEREIVSKRVGKIILS